MQYISAAEASEKWGVSLRHVQRLLAAGRIPCAKKYGRVWMIPDDAGKPADPRREKKPQKSLSAELAHVIAATSVPMPPHHPDAILNAVGEERLRLQYEADLAYLRGDFRRAMCCFHKTEGDDAARLRASLVAVAAAISMGDYPAYLKIEAYLKSCVDTGGSDISACAQLALASVAVSVTAPNMVPRWLKDGDFSALPAPSQADPAYMIYLRTKYFLCIGQYETALAVAQTALAFCAAERGVTFPRIYLRTVCALACHCLERGEEAGRWLLQAMRIALPHGFITPFAEIVSDLGGLMEQYLEREFPEYYDAVIEQWKRTIKNWITFHNHFTKDNITLVLSLREYHLAMLVARRVPYAKIAKQFNISVGRLKNIMLEIYEKLFISSRDELAEYVLLQKTTSLKRPL
ncbi:MAG TPA: helix-turn-helix domain-containing protein [Feifaniaceae bacterium]|nr:helix-turn-helix domain-containing protein [Feifaniaceae bacterium]